MSEITTHVLDTALGLPASGIRVELAQFQASAWRPLSEARTDSDGRVRAFPNLQLEPGSYRLTFDVGAYFAAAAREAFYDSVEVSFRVQSLDRNYHVPLLLSPFGYSTYRGS